MKSQNETFKDEVQSSDQITAQRDQGSTHERRNFLRRHLIDFGSLAVCGVAAFTLLAFQSAWLSENEYLPSSASSRAPTSASAVAGEPSAVSLDPSAARGVHTFAPSFIYAPTLHLHGAGTVNVYQGMPALPPRANLGTEIPGLPREQQQEIRPSPPLRPGVHPMANSPGRIEGGPRIEGAPRVEGSPREEAAPRADTPINPNEVSVQDLLAELPGVLRGLDELKGIESSTIIKDLRSPEVTLKAAIDKDKDKKVLKSFAAQIRYFEKVPDAQGEQRYCVVRLKGSYTQSPSDPKKIQVKVEGFRKSAFCYARKDGSRYLVRSDNGAPIPDQQAREMLDRASRNTSMRFSPYVRLSWEKKPAEPRPVAPATERPAADRPAAERPVAEGPAPIAREGAQ